MFATLLGALPMPAPSDADDAAGGAVGHAIRAQEAAGLEPITDGRLIDPEFAHLRAALTGAQADDRTGRDLIERWRAAAALTDRAVKQALPGPYSVGRLAGVDGRQREAMTLRVAESVGRLAGALGTAGCMLVEIEESQAHRIGEDEAERRLFGKAHRRLLESSGRANGSHLSLSIVGGSAAGAGTATILELPYASLAVDLIAGPDNWSLVTRSAGDRGIVAGVLSGGNIDEPREVMLWAAHYAASSGGRGLARVGLGSAGSWANLAWDAAVRKMELLGGAARLASMPAGEELARSLDPRAVSSRRAALGHDAQMPRRRR